MQPVRARTYRHARPVVVVVVVVVAVAVAVGTAINMSSMRGGGAPKVTAGKRRRILLPAVGVGVVDIINFGVREGGEAANCPASPSRRGEDDVASAFVHDVMSFMTPARPVP